MIRRPLRSTQSSASAASDVYKSQVGDHLRRRNHDRLDVLVGIDAAGSEPVPDPQIVGAAREGHRGLDRFAGRLLGVERGLEPVSYTHLTLPTIYSV